MFIFSTCSIVWFICFSDTSNKIFMSEAHYEVETFTLSRVCNKSILGASLACNISFLER